MGKAVAALTNEEVHRRDVHNYNVWADLPVGQHLTPADGTTRKIHVRDCPLPTFDERCKARINFEGNDLMCTGKTGHGDNDCHHAHIRTPNGKFSFKVIAW